MKIKKKSIETGVLVLLGTRTNDSTSTRGVPCIGTDLMAHLFTQGSLERPLKHKKLPKRGKETLHICSYLDNSHVPLQLSAVWAG